MILGLKGGDGNKGLPPAERGEICALYGTGALTLTELANQFGVFDARDPQSPKQDRRRESRHGMTQSSRTTRPSSNSRPLR